MLGLVISAVIFAVWFVVLNRRSKHGQSMPSRTKLRWGKVAVLALAIVVQVAGLPRDDEADALSFDGVADADFELLTPVAQLVSQTAGDGERFAAVVSVDPSFSNSVVAIATYEVQKNVPARGLVAGPPRFEARNRTLSDLDHALVTVRGGQLTDRGCVSQS